MISTMPVSVSSMKFPMLQQATTLVHFRKVIPHRRLPSWACPPSMITLRSLRREGFITHFCTANQSRNHIDFHHAVHEKGRHHSSLTKNNINVHQQKEVVTQGTIPSHGKGIQVGQFAEIHSKYSQNDVNTFGALIGDFNPVHFPASRNPNDNDTQEKLHNNHKKPIVHGILLSSVFSTIFGTLIPGCIYRSQSLKFHSPVYIDEQAIGRVVVKKLRQINIRSSGGGVLCTCETSVTKMKTNLEGGDDKKSTKSTDANQNDVLCVSGEAQVWLPGVTISEK